MPSRAHTLTPMDEQANEQPTPYAPWPMDRHLQRLTERLAALGATEQEIEDAVMRWHFLDDDERLRLHGMADTQLRMVLVATRENPNYESGWLA